MDEHFVAGEQIVGLQRVGIEREDIEGMRNYWLTDNCVREVIARFGNFKTCVNIVDPNWLNEWIRMGGYSPPITPDFFRPNPGVAFVQGLAIPFNEGNRHWSALYVDLEHCGAIYFNTMPCIEREQNASQVMLRFYTTFSNSFQGKGVNKFQFVVDQQTPSQADTQTCGIYAAAAVIDLLSMARPRTEPLTREQIRIFRENGVKWLEDTPKMWGWLNRNTPFKAKAKKEIHWDPSII